MLFRNLAQPPTGICCNCNHDACMPYNYFCQAGFVTAVCLSLSVSVCLPPCLSVPLPDNSVIWLNLVNNYGSLVCLVECWALVSPCLIYSVEIQGSNYWNSLQSLYIPRNRAIRVINQAGYRAQAHLLLLQSGIVKLRDQIDYQTAQITFKA